MPTLPPPPRAPLGHAALDLLAHARSGLAEAAAATTPGDRYVAAHLAALRAGAAVLAARARPPRGRGRRGPRNVWAVLTDVAPELSEWAAFFAAGADKRAAAEAGLSRAVNGREADDLLRDAETFLGLVTALLGVPHQPPLAVSAGPCLPLTTVGRRSGHRGDGGSRSADPVDPVAAAAVRRAG
jgi:hypothetical protein